MPYGWKIERNGQDISDKVAGFVVSCSLESFCREMTLDIADPDLYADFDLQQIPEEPEIEIFTKAGGDWVSQGRFFVERPALASQVESGLMQGVWGRSETAKLAEPFARKVTKSWDTKTTFFGICQEMCEAAGLAWNPAYSEIEDFVVFPYTYKAEGVYPIDVLSDLAALAGGVVTTDRQGHVRVSRVEYAPGTEDATVTDADIAEIEERPEWPSFGNRVRISPTGAAANYSVSLSVEDRCLRADGVGRAKVYAQVRDPDGAPVNDAVVAWSHDGSGAQLEAEESNTSRVLFVETQKALDFYRVSVRFPPAAVVGIWAYSDARRSKNLAAAGCETEGTAIVLAERLKYCDQTLVVAYEADGVAQNALRAGAEPEDVTITANVSGQQDRGTVYIENPCACPPTINLLASPTRIEPGQKAGLLVYVEEGGAPSLGRMVFMAETSRQKRGVLSWTKARLGYVAVNNEKTLARNEIAGITQCGLSMMPESVNGVYLTDDDGSPIGLDLYDSHDGKTVYLSGELPTGTPLVVSYTAKGAALNHFTGQDLGEAMLTAYILTTREAGAEATTTVWVQDNSQPTSAYPGGWSMGLGDGDDGGIGGDEEEFDRQEEQEPEDPCLPESVAHDPSEANLAARFEKALENDCDCSQICHKEFDVYGTTQGYDNASGRTISQIVVEDYGFPEGSAAYWEKYEELRSLAIGECVEDCGLCAEAEPLLWSEDNPETMGSKDEVTIRVTGGVPPYTWSVGGSGFSVGATVTEGQTNILFSSDTACGSAEVTVTDACDKTVTGVVRCTTGFWALIEEKGSYHGPAEYDEECVIGRFKYFDDVCCAAPPPQYTCDEGPWPRHCFIDPGCSISATEHYKVWEWQC